MPFPTDTASYPLIDGIYQRPEGTPVAVLGPNDGVANRYIEPFPGALGGRYLFTHRGEFATLSGQGYFMVRWEYGYFNRGGVITAATAPLIEPGSGTFLKRVGVSDRYMPDQYFDSTPGATGLWRPGLQGTSEFIPVTTSGEPGTPTLWINEYYYLDGTVKFTNRESGADYNFTLTPVTWQGIHDTILNGKVYTTSQRPRPAMSMDPFISATVPSSPVNVTATVVSDGQVRLNWADCANNETSYLVEYSYGGDFGDPGKTISYPVGKLYANSAVVPAGSTSRTVGVLMPSTKYAFRVKAINSAGDSAYSNVVEVTTPASTPLASPWSQANIVPDGTAVAIAGATSLKDGNVSMRAATGDIWYQADDFYFVYQPMVGNGSITARVVDVGFTSNSAKAGVMIRDTLTSGSAYMMTKVQPFGGARGQWRQSQNGGSADAGDSPNSEKGPYWVRMTRNGNVFTSETSPDGVTWTVMSTRTITMGNTVYVGLATSTRSNTDTPTIGVSSFDNVKLN